MKPSHPGEHTAVHIAELFRSFGDISRVRILYAIKEQEMNTSKLAELFGLTESVVSIICTVYDSSTGYTPIV